MSDIQKQLALVTGSSRGIGRAIAERLSEDGYTVVVNYSGDTASAEDVVKSIKDKGGNAIAIQANVADENDVARMFSEVKQLTGKIDVVVHSAGVMPLTKITPAGLADFDKVINTNLRGAFLVLANSAENISDGGRIIALTTSVIAKSFPTYGPYIASKAGVEGLIHVLANELRGRNITVNAVAPGPTGTELFFNGKSTEQINSIAKLSPLERIGTPEEIANIISMLVSEDGGWVNSQVIRVNGGFA